MKPNFALSLSFEGIRLLLRAAEGWRLVADLANLEAKARALSDDPVSSKLIVPNDQIKYVTLETGNLSEDERDQLALDALEGTTPYAVSDLTYDVSSDGSRTYIATVAREADAFAKEHNFNPVSWVAISEEGNFRGDFGPTSSANGITVIPDETTIVVFGKASDLPQAVPSAIDEPSLSEEIEPEVVFEEVSEISEPLIADVFVEEVVATKIVDCTATESTSAPVDNTSEPDPTIAKSPPVPEAATETYEKPLSLGFASRRGPNGASPSLAGATRDVATASITSASVPPIEDTPAKTPGLVAIDPPEPQIAAGFLSRRKQPDAAAIPAPALTSAAPSTEAQRLTIFGARKPDRKTVIGGKPRFLGLTLTAALLLLLAGVAAWASVLMDEELARLFINSPNDSTIAVAPAGLAPAPPDESEPVITTASLSTDLSSEDTAVLDALRAPQADPVVVLPQLSVQKLAANYAVTGIWPISPEIPQPASLVSLDDLYIASIDPVRSSNDAIALPDVRALNTDRGIGEQSAPVAVGTSFTLGADGLVVPTVDGAITPNGVIVFLGRPVATPPKTPTRKAEPAKIDPALALIAKLRPQSRPSNLVEQNEQGANVGLSHSKLAQLRPRLRPAHEQALAQQTIDPNTRNTQNDSAAAAASLAGLAPRTHGIVIEGPLNPKAGTASMRPNGRPNKFAQLIKQNKAQQSNDQGTRVVSIAPKVVVPKIPSSANVAKSATVMNAINLRNVNLIGVYGKPSSRRALVRLSNGRYQKVQVGDRIDAGRVSAIGDNELRYKKGSRNLTLKMPKS